MLGPSSACRDITLDVTHPRSLTARRQGVHGVSHVSPVFPGHVVIALPYGVAYVHRQAHALIDGSAAMTAPQCRSHVNRGIPSRVVLGKYHNRRIAAPCAVLGRHGGADISHFSDAGILSVVFIDKKSITKTILIARPFVAIAAVKGGRHIGHQISPALAENLLVAQADS